MQMVKGTADAWQWRLVTLTGSPAPRSQTTTSCWGCVCQKERFGKRSPPNIAFFINCRRFLFSDMTVSVGCAKMLYLIRMLCPLTRASRTSNGGDGFRAWLPVFVEAIFEQRRFHLGGTAAQTPGLIVAVNHA